MHAALHRGTAGSSKYLDIHAALHRGTAGSSKYLDIHAALHRGTAGSSKYLDIHAALHRGTAGSSKYLDIYTALHRGTARSSRAVHAPALHGAVSGAKDKWTCEVCGKVFAHTSNYKNHIRTHSDDRPFVCHICSIGFKERYHLKKHALFKLRGALSSQEARAVQAQRRAERGMSTLWEAVQGLDGGTRSRAHPLGRAALLMSALRQGVQDERMSVASRSPQQDVRSTTPCCRQAAADVDDCCTQ